MTKPSDPHTPGPWQIVKSAGPDKPATIGRYTPEGLEIIARLPSYGYTLPHGVAGHGTRNANACLIASAPDLLAALEAMVKAHGGWSAAGHQATAAIAKAKS